MTIDSDNTCFIAPSPPTAAPTPSPPPTPVQTAASDPINSDPNHFPAQSFIAPNDQPTPAPNPWAINPVTTAPVTDKSTVLVFGIIGGLVVLAIACAITFVYCWYIRSGGPKTAKGRMAPRDQAALISRETML